MLKMLQEQLCELERETVQALSQMAEIRKKIQEVSGMDVENINELEVAQVPFAAYEMQLERNLEEKKEIEERHEREKDKMRKHYRTLILWIAIPFLTFIVAVFGSVVWFLNTYDIMSYAQDVSAGDYGNAIIEDGITHSVS